MYEKIKNILNSETKEEAERKLFGEEGIKINTQEYYQSIISRFIRKKDLIIPKVNNEIVFDLDKDVKSIGDILFISEFVKKEFLNKYKSFVDNLKEDIRNADLPDSNMEEKQKIDMIWRLPNLSFEEKNILKERYI